MESTDFRRYLNPCRTPEEAKRFRGTVIKALALIGVLALLTVVFYNQLAAFFRDPTVFRGWVEEKGFFGKLAFIGLMSLQIIVPFLPGEPMEVAAGVAFGTFEGLVLCMAGACVGGFFVFLIVRRLGERSLETLFSEEALRQTSFLRDSKRFTLLFTLLFLIPGTPKDILAYCAGLTKMRMGTYLLISTFARIPSIITSTIAGSALNDRQYPVAIAVYGVTALIALGGLIYYRKLSKGDCPEKKGVVK